MQESRLAWIFGSSRSGSTWLLKMLSDLKGVVPVDDPHLGHHLGVWRPIPLAWATSDDPPQLSTLLELKADEPGYFFAERHREAWWGPLRELITARFEAQAPEAGRRRSGAGGGLCRQGAGLPRGAVPGRALPAIEGDFPPARRPRRRRLLARCL